MSTHFTRKIGWAAAVTTALALPLTALSSTAAAAEPTSGKGVSQLAPRVLYAHAGGLTLINSKTGKRIKETERGSFMRLSQAGDGRHVMVADGDEFLVYDGGIEAHEHGDHDHYYRFPAGLTKVSYDAPEAGHVVPHHGYTTLFSDGLGEMWTLPTDKIAVPGTPTQHFTAPSAHHGVALRLSDGRTLHTLGNEAGRNGAQVIGEDGAAQVVTENCPGVHGEAAAKPRGGKDVVVLGCEDGPIIFHDATFTKVKVKHAYARTGNLKGLDDSRIVLGDYKIDKAATPERPTRISLINTATAKLRLVNLGSAYWFRSLARNDKTGDAVVLTYDGRVTVVNETTGKITKRIKAIRPWRENKDWQRPGPAIQVADGLAYVTDVKTNRLVVVNLAKGTVIKRHKLAHTPVEFQVVTGHAHH